MTSHPQTDVAGVRTGSAATPGRVVVVADPEDALAETVRTALAEVSPAGEVEQAGDYMDALGRLSRRPAAVVIGPAEALHGIERGTARALRHIAPRATLLVVAETANNGRSTMFLEAGFDQCLVQPLDHQALTQTLAAAGSETDARRDAAGIPPLSGLASLVAGITAPPSARVSNAPPEAKSARENTDAATNGKPAEKQHAPTRSESDDPAPAEAPLHETPQPTLLRDEEPPDEATQALGDTDLVEAILSETGELREMALDLLRRQSSLSEPGLVEAADEAPANHAATAVTRDGQMFGVLHAAAPADRLAAWAGWLAHWLAMEHRLRGYHQMAMRDELTGVWNRRYFDQFLARVLPKAQRDRAQVTLLLFDIDDFKHYNDTYGHPAGDDILINVGQLMQSMVRDHDVVARIGGDEFAVIFWEAEGPRHAPGRHPHDVLAVAQRFQQAVCDQRFPRLLNEAPGTLTISGGLASFPWDGRSAEELLEQADANALEAKQQGKNVITFGPGATRQAESAE